MLSRVAITVHDFELMRRRRVSDSKRGYYQRKLFKYIYEPDLFAKLLDSADIVLHELLNGEQPDGKQHVWIIQHLTDATLVKHGFKALFKRFGIALTIGAALIGPMLLMVLHPGKVTALVTTSVAVFLFSVFIATWLTLFNSEWEDSDQEVLSASAAYAAVLVVFVGASLTLGG
jgi:hypothetical protein